MWTYKSVTRKEFEIRKDFVEKILVNLGAEPIDYVCVNKVISFGKDIWDSIVSDRKIYRYKKDFFRVDEVLFPNKPFIVIEWTDRMEYALNNVMEDTEPFPYDLNDEEIIEEVKNILRE